MSTQFFYHDPLDSPNSGGSFMRCEASYDIKRTGPTTVELTIHTKFVARKTSTTYREYGVNYDNKRDGAYDTILEKLTAEQEWNFDRTFRYTVTKEAGSISFWYYAFYLKNGSVGNESGYDTTFTVWYPAYVIAPTITTPVISNIKDNQFSFSWNVSDTGGEYPTVNTEIYNHPDHLGKWIGLDKLGYGQISSGTVVDLTRYTTYGIRAHAKNSVGEVRSKEVLFQTMPSVPTFSGITISNIKTDSIQYSWSVVDNGGKGITTYKTQIFGGQYSEWTDVTTTASGIINNLLHNTTYEIRAYASNDLSEGTSSSKSFTTLGDDPVITAFRAETISLHKIQMFYSADYDLNASFKRYVVKYRESGTTKWISLDENIRVANGLKSGQRYEFQLTVTDNWNRSRISEDTVVYTEVDIMDFDEPLVSISGNNVTIKENFVFPSNCGLNIVNNYIRVKPLTGVYTFLQFASYPDTNKLQEITFDCTNSSTYLHPYKEYEAYYVLVDDLGNNYTSKSCIFQVKQDHNTINIIKSDGSINKLSKFKTISSTSEVREINYRDFIKLSKKMRYVLIGSNGIRFGRTHDIADFKSGSNIKYKFSVTPESNNVLAFNINSLKVTFSDETNAYFKKYKNTNNSFRVLFNFSSNNKSTKLYDIKERYVTVLDASKIEFGKETELIDKTSSLGTIAYLTVPEDLRGDSLCINGKTEFGNLFNGSSTTGNVFTQTFSNKSLLSESDDLWNNSLVEIDIYDKNGKCISKGLPITSLQNKSVISVNGGNVTDMNHSDPSKYVKCSGDDTFIIDLGDEYEISKINIWRRWSNDNSVEYIYQDNFIYGLNSNKEICYKFYDYRSLLTEDIKESSNGSSFIVK